MNGMRLALKRACCFEFGKTSCNTTQSCVTEFSQIFPQRVDFYELLQSCRGRPCFKALRGLWGDVLPFCSGGLRSIAPFLLFRRPAVFNFVIAASANFC
jgi:hypothetical protein